MLGTRFLVFYVLFVCIYSTGDAWKGAYIYCGLVLTSGKRYYTEPVILHSGINMRIVTYTINGTCNKLCIGVAYPRWSIFPEKRNVAGMLPFQA
jgi:hypothetical protein